MSERVVHAQFSTGHEIVRYSGPGKWYVEHKQLPRSPCASVQDAAEQTVNLMRRHTGAVFYGRSGGRVFDARVRVLLDEFKESTEQERNEAKSADAKGIAAIQAEIKEWRAIANSRVGSEQWWPTLRFIAGLERALELLAKP